MISVTELNEQAKFLLESHFYNVAVEGEISRFNKHQSGHWYFVLKDENSSISAAMFKSNNLGVKFEIKDGLKVVIYGKVTIYPANGNYQIVAHKMEPAGIGGIELGLQQLKEKLQKEGFLDSNFSKISKKSVPNFPKKVAIITALNSAALGDMKVVMSQKWSCKFDIYGSLVQGERAAQNIINILQKIDTLGYDAIVLARGGGSKEDLWCFNDETLARTILALQTPLVTGIGHEQDYTICDFVCDRRSSTPTKVMQDLLPDKYEILQYLDLVQSKFQNFINSKVENLEDRLNFISKSIGSGGILQKISMLNSNLENIRSNFNYAMDKKITNLAHEISKFEVIFNQKNIFFEQTKDLVKIKKDGAIANLSTLKSGDVIEISSQNSTKNATIN